MTSKEAAVKPQDVPAPKTVSRATYWQSLVITFLASGVLGLVGGYFASISLHSDARAAVVQDMQIVSKSVEQ